MSLCAECAWLLHDREVAGSLLLYAIVSLVILSVADIMTKG